MRLKCFKRIYQDRVIRALLNRTPKSLLRSVELKVVLPSIIAFLSSHSASLKHFKYFLLSSYSSVSSSIHSTLQVSLDFASVRTH